MTMHDIIVVGSIVVDLISYVENFPSIGQTVFGQSFQKGFGGKGANQCVMAKLLGAKCTMIGKVGDDDFGKEYLERFKKVGIDTANILTSSSSCTGVATIIVRSDGCNEIVITPGANFDLSPGDVSICSEIISQSKVVVCQLEIPIESVFTTLRIAKQHSVLSILNPAPIPIGGFNLSEMPPVDIFCPNETEASLLTNITITDVTSAVSAIQYFLDFFSHKIKWPMITLGHLGVVFGDSTTKDIIHEPAPVVHALDTTGAGDCFAGSLAYYCAFHADLSLREKVKKSIKIASLSVQKYGTQSSFPDFETVQTLS